MAETEVPIHRMKKAKTCAAQKRAARREAIASGYGVAQMGTARLWYVTHRCSGNAPATCSRGYATAEAAWEFICG